MNRLTLLAAVVFVGWCLTLAEALTADEIAVEDRSLGLEKSSVFSTPTPAPPSYNAGFPGRANDQPMYPGLPPQIPHGVEGLVPLTAERNTCLGCHDNPALRGMSIPGVPTAMPESHYTDLRNSPDQLDNKLDSARYLCTQCHAPQADAAPLVTNTYAQ